MSYRARYKKPRDVPVAINYKTVGADEEDYEVEEILNHEVVNGSTLYFISWKGYDESWNTWEPESCLTGCPDKLKEYKLKAGIPLAGHSPVKTTPAKQPTPEKRPEKPPAGPAPKTSPKKKSREQELEEKREKQRKKRLKAKQKQVTARKSVGTGLKVYTWKPSGGPATVGHSSATSTQATTKKSYAAKILEIIDDGTGMDQWMVSIHVPGREDPYLMWYNEAKTKHPNLLIEFFEKYIQFDMDIVETYELVPPD